MADGPEWTQQAYEGSLSSRCWWCTIYDDGWEACRGRACDISADAELREIVAMEQALGEVPAWARQIVERSINFLPLCGHYAFPLAYREAVAAIGAETPVDFVHGCYTVDGERKRQMRDYVLALDGWLAGAAAEAVGRELAALAARRIDWPAVCRDLWAVLGEPTELKRLLVERLVHSQRHKIKERTWHDDRADVFGRDQYVGDFVDPGEVQNPGDQCAYSHRPSPAFPEASSPAVRRIEQRIEEICPDAGWFLYTIAFGWLCAPAAFRHLERLLWAIGRERQCIHTHDHPLEGGDDVPGFLRIEDTLPDRPGAERWWRAFLAALKGWWDGRAAAGQVADEVHAALGERTPAKRWLVRLLVRKLELPEGRAVAVRGPADEHEP